MSELPTPLTPPDCDVSDIPIPAAVLVACAQHDFNMSRARAISTLRPIIRQRMEEPDRTRLLSELRAMQFGAGRRRTP